VPVGETDLRFLVEVGPVGAPVLSQEVTAAAASLDVSGLSGSQLVRVAQLSDTYGPGTWASLSVAI